MADSGIKKVLIPKAQLPSVSQDNKYTVRFRIVSEDRNRFSEWSQKFVVDGSPISTVTSDHSVSGKIITIVWQDPNPRSAYDIFVKLDNNPYVYHGTSTSTSYVFMNQAVSTLRYAIQVQGIGREYNPSLVIYQSNPIGS
jgi:hypothetical protein